MYSQQNWAKTTSVYSPWVEIGAETTKLYYLFIHVHNFLYLKVFSQCQKEANGKILFFEFYFNF